jgi:hypothetical protein
LTAKAARTNAALLKLSGELAENLLMTTWNPRAADVISDVGETPSAICKARGIEFKSLDEAMIDKLLRNSFSDYRSSGRLVANATCIKRS